MIPVPMTAARAPRAPHAAAKADAGATVDANDDTDATAQQHILAIQRQQFNFQMEEDAESLREQEALEELRMAQVKNEDEIVKKWIELI